MNWYAAPYTIVLIALSGVAIALAMYSGQRRRAPGAVVLMLFMFGTAQWLLGYAFEIGFEDLANKVFWAKWQYVGIVSIPVAWAAFGHQIRTASTRLTWRKLGLLALLPLTTLALVWTNQYHGWVWRQLALETTGSFPTLKVAYGPWFWVHTLYSYALLLAGTYFLLATVLRSPHLYRRQIGLILAGIAAPWLGNGLYLAGLSPVPNLDLTPFGFLLTGIMFAVSLLRFRLLDIVPVARDAIVEGMRDGMIVLDPKLRLVDVNPAARSILNIAPQGVVGKPAADVLPASVLAVAADASDGDATLQIVLPDADEERIYELSRSQLVDQGGHAAGVLLVMRDLTQRVQTEAALRDSEARYRTVSELASDYAFAFSLGTDGQLHLDWVTDAFSRITGYSVAEVRQMGGWAALVHPDDAPRAERYEATIVAGKVAAVELRFVAKDGEIRWIHSSSRPIIDPRSGHVTRVIGAGQDITERKQAESVLQQQNEYLAALHETTLGLMRRLDVDDVLQAIIARAGALIGSPHGYIYLVDPETGDLVVHIGTGIFEDKRGYRIRSGEEQGLAGAVRETGQAITVDDYHSWSNHRRDLENLPFRAVVGAPLTSGSHVVGVIGLAHVVAGQTFDDQTIAMLERFARLASIALDNARLYTTAQQELAERTRAEADLALARDQAVEAARLKAEFLATMSHELRTPLNAIIGFTDLTLDEDGGSLNPRQRSSLERVSRNARNLLSMIENILDMSKIDAGHMQLAHEEILVDDVVTSAVNSIETLVADKQLHLDLINAVRSLTVRGDAGRLNQIVLNLLSNAVKFTPPGGTIKVILEHGATHQICHAAVPAGGARPGEFVVVSVRDTGIGVPADQHDRIWSEFYQIDGSATRQYGGTGLGLAIVKRLTDLMGGHVGFESKPHAGSTFSIWLPAAGQEQTECFNGHATVPVDDTEAALSERHSTVEDESRW